MKPYHWFQGTSVRELYNQLSVANPDTCRLEVYQLGPHMAFQVVQAPEPESPTETTGPRHIFPEVNDSHICPPSCP